MRLRYCRMEYISRAPQPPLDGLIDDLYYLEGTPPYAMMTLPAAPAPLLIINLGAPFRVRGGRDSQPREYVDGCVVAAPTRAWDFGYPARIRSVGAHFKACGLAPFLPMPVLELCDRPATVEQIWGRDAVAELRDRLAASYGPQEMLILLEEELIERLREIDGLDLVRQACGMISATNGALPIGDLSASLGVSSTHLAQKFRALIGITPKRLARVHRFTFSLLALNPAEPVDWGDFAAGAGYFDQAHFTREFREFTGLTPTRYLELRRRFLHEHPDHALDNWPLPTD